jgi:hypothetical protein
MFYFNIAVAAPPPMGGFVTPMAQMGPPMGMQVKHPGDGPSEDEPSNKKMRNEDSLIPEEVFLSRNPVKILRNFYNPGLYFFFVESCRDQDCYSNDAREGRMEVDWTDADLKCASGGKRVFYQIENTGRDEYAAS